MSSTRNADGVAVADQCRRDSPLNQRRSTVTCRHSRINFWLNCVWLDKKNWRESLIIMINVWRSFLFLLDFLFHLTQCNSGNCVNTTWLIVFFTLARFATGSCLWPNVSLDVPISWFRWALPFLQGGGFSNFSLRRHPIKCWMATLLPVLSYFSISDGNLYLPSIQVPIFFYKKKNKNVTRRLNAFVSNQKSRVCVKWNAEWFGDPISIPPGQPTRTVIFNSTVIMRK
jgi:hypothetical protein